MFDRYRVLKAVTKITKREDRPTIEAIQSFCPNLSAGFIISLCEEKLLNYVSPTYRPNGSLPSAYVLGKDSHKYLSDFKMKLFTYIVSSITVIAVIVTLVITILKEF